METITNSIKIGLAWALLLISQVDSEPAQIILTPFQMMLIAAGMSSLGGLAASLRNEAGTVRSSLTVMLNTSILGAGIAMVGYSFVASSPVKIWLVIGVATLASLGGLSMLDLVVQTVRARFQAIGKQQEQNNE